MAEDRGSSVNRPDKIGILTFHCADNFGAMLQAYGLLTWLSKEGFDAFIVNYAPPFLRGREWLFPYVPYKNLLKRMDVFLWGLKRNLKAGRDWRTRKRLMEDFRTARLTGGSKAFHGNKGLLSMEADLLVVGSDQIWNPDITCGLRPAYFGAFENDRLRKTIAYGASFGASSLPEEEVPRFSELLLSVQDVSMREKSAAEYIEAISGRKISNVVDPVFLLDGDDWRAIEEKPAEDGFILYYETEPSEPMRETAHRLAQEKDLKVIALSANANEWGDWPFQGIWAVGPAQFLGYVSAAEYVITNSFHGAAFSILFHKPFCTFVHSTVGTRLESLLEDVDLTNRMAVGDYRPDIDEEIDWTEVERLLQIQRERSMGFLRRSLTS